MATLRPACVSGHGTLAGNSYGFALLGSMSAHVPNAAGWISTVLPSMDVTIRYTPPPRSALSNSTVAVPLFAAGANREPRTLPTVGAMVSLSATPTRPAARRIGKLQVLMVTPPQPAVSVSWAADRPLRFTVPDTSAPQALGRQPSMSVLSALIWYVRNPPLAAPVVERSIDTPLTRVSSGALKRKAALRPPCHGPGPDRPADRLPPVAPQVFVAVADGDSMASNPRAAVGAPDGPAHSQSM